MHRTQISATILFAVCSAAAFTACGNKADEPTGTETAKAPKGGGAERIAVPTSKGPMIGGHGDPLSDPTGAPGGAPKDDNTKLSAEEGQLTIEPPANLKAGVPSAATLRLIPAKGYDVNLKYTFKLNLTPPDGVTLDKAALKGGGHDGNGDAETLELRQLTVPVKLVAAKAGDYSISGQFEFAICKEDACLTKHVPVSLQIAAK